jgi:SAM-dependent methyltransferase
MSGPYDNQFFESHAEGSLASARTIVPYVVSLIGCKSVVDVGCGQGYWLAAFREAGVDDIQGFDGDYVAKEKLAIPPEAFTPCDLNRPLEVTRRFDLAMSLEVAEHLRPEVSGAFVDSLTALSPAVLFSASLPFQDGTHHVNEEWIEFWVDMFKQRGYLAIDCLRPRFWNDSRVEWWYAQNAVLYIEKDKIGDYPRLASIAKETVAPVSLVHPKFLMHKEAAFRQLPPLKDLWVGALMRTWGAVISRLRGRKSS